MRSVRDVRTLLILPVVIVGCWGVYCSGIVYCVSDLAFSALTMKVMTLAEMNNSYMSKLVSITLYNMISDSERFRKESNNVIWQEEVVEEYQLFLMNNDRS